MNDDQTNSKRKVTISRRDFLKISLSSAMSVAALLAGKIIFDQNEADWWEVSQVRLVLPNLPRSFSGIRLVQISDIHFGGWMNIERLKTVLEIVKKLSPNLVALTGDFVLSSSWRQIEQSQLLAMEAELRSLADLCPTLAVLGNHDHWADPLTISTMLTNAGVEILKNTVRRFENGKDAINFAGVDDVFVGNDRLDLVLAQLPSTGCAILLAHEPDFATSSALTERFDLQISGHSHGGQVNLPWLGTPILPDWARTYPRGLYRVGNMALYTNRGIGMARPYIRVNCRPEITVFTLISQ